LHAASAEIRMQLASQQIDSLDDLSFVKGEAGLQPMHVKMDYSNMLVA